MSSALLLSGGMDSIALAWWKRPTFAFTIDYGQLAAKAEAIAASAVARDLGLRHVMMTVDARALGSGDMAGKSPDAQAPASDWWPYRNQLLVTVAGMKAVALGVTELMLGTVATDEIHRDGTVEFIHKLDAVMACQEGGLRVTAPGIEFTTIELIRMSGIPCPLLAWAHSCHKANVPCGQCRGCNKHLAVLKALDPGSFDG